MEERQIDWRRTNIWQTHQHSQWWDASATLLCHEQWTYCRSAKTLRFLALDRCFTLYTCYKLQPPIHILVSIISYGMSKNSCPNNTKKLSKTDEVHQKTRWNEKTRWSPLQMTKWPFLSSGLGPFPSITNNALRLFCVFGPPPSQWSSVPQGPNHATPRPDSQGHRCFGMFKVDRDPDVFIKNNGQHKNTKKETTLEKKKSTASKTIG